MVYSDLLEREVPAYDPSPGTERTRQSEPEGSNIQMRKAMNRSVIGQRLKQLREELKLSMRELAARSGTSVSLISKIEAGTVSPTVLSLEKIVESMGIEMYEFFLDQNGQEPTARIVFKKQDMVVSEDEDRTWRFAFPKQPDIKAQAKYIEYVPHSKVSEWISHKSDTLGYVMSGELTLSVAGMGTFTAAAGDAFYIKAGTPHEVRNKGNKTMKMLAVLLRE